MVPPGENPGYAYARFGRGRSQMNERWPLQLSRGRHDLLSQSKTLFAIFGKFYHCLFLNYESYWLM